MGLIPRDPIEFVEFKLGSDAVSITLQGYESWSSWLSQPDAAFLRFNFSLPVNARLAFFARKNEPPSLTAYHMLEVISQEKSHKLYKREADTQVNPISSIFSSIWLQGIFLLIFATHSFNTENGS